MDAVLMNQIALGLFLVLNLVVAYYATKGAPKTMESYALANRSLGTTTLLLSLFATLMSTDNVALYLTYTDGVMGFFYPLTFVGMTLFLGYFVFPKLVYFRKEYTVAGVMKSMYGPFALLSTVLIMTLFSFLMIVAQLKEFGQMGVFLGLPPTTLIIGLGLFIACYTSVGGVRSVAFTDVLQFVVFAGGFLVFGTIVIRSHSGFAAIWEQFPKDSELGLFLSHPTFGRNFFSIFFWSIWPTVLISPPIVQRVLMTPSEKRVRSIFLIFGGSYLFFRILTTIVSATLFCVSEEIPDGMVSIEIIVGLICKNIIGRLLFILSFAAVVMSTADSLLNGREYYVDP